MPLRMKLTKNPVFLHYFSKFMGILLFVLKYMYIFLLLKMINGFSWPAKIMDSPFKYCKWVSLWSKSICVTCKLLMSVYFDMKSLYPHLKVNWNMLMCKICIARRLVVDIFPWCNANSVPFPQISIYKLDTNTLPQNRNRF